jgi:hypothetical protein
MKEKMHHQSEVMVNLIIQHVILYFWFSEVDVQPGIYAEAPSRLTEGQYKRCIQNNDMKE